MIKKIFTAGLLLSLSACSALNVFSTQPITGDWKITHINGKQTVDFADAKIVFADDNQVNGTSGCNNFMGTYSQESNQLKIKPGSATLKACVESLLKQERNLFKSLNAITRIKKVKGTISLLDEKNNERLRLASN